MSFIFLFPSQSARYPGMLEHILELYPPGEDLVRQAERVLDIDLQEATLHYRDNRDVQLGVFVVNYLYQRWLESHEVRAVASVGTSLGELNHLVHIGALSYEEGLRLVDQRGRAYDEGPEGARLVLFPISLKKAESLLEGSNLEIAGNLSPQAVLVGGDLSEVQDLSERLKQTHPKLFVRELGVKLPIHSSHFRCVGDAFRKVLDRTSFREPHLPYLPNATAQWMPTPKEIEIRDVLTRQVYQPLLWSESVDVALAHHPEAALVEVGPSNSLLKLFALSPDWHTEVRKVHAEGLVAEKGTTI